MIDNIQTLKQKYWPKKLFEIPQPPKQLYIRGELPKNQFTLCVVGSRKHSSYGKEICEHLISGLKGYPITIVSGLAYGIDTLAHKSAIEAGLKTVAVPGSGISDGSMYPKTNLKLAKKIIKSGGCILSEFDPDLKATSWSFPKRNRIMAGLSDAVLVIEAEEKSGTLITSRLATDYNREVLTIPGSIFSSNSKGPHMLIRLGATPITCVEDILEVFGLDEGAC
jgi:DNA processing protein